MFFDAYPPSFYIAPNGDKILVTDWIRAIRIPPEILNDPNLYETYMCRDNETPEIISHKIYNTTSYHWVIMLTNQRFDVWNDFPKDDATIRKFCIEKYGSTDEVHHYVNAEGTIVDEYDDEKIPVTNIEFEFQRNEDKRFIKILKPIFLSEFVAVYRQLISDGEVT